MVGHNDRGVKSNGDKLEEELSEVRLEMTKCAAWLEACTHVPPLTLPLKPALVDHLRSTQV